MRIGSRLWAGRSALAVAACLLVPAAGGAATLRLAETVMTGLANPRGLAFGPDGGLYVAEAGSGGAGATIPGPEGPPQGFGLTSGVSRLLGGTQARVATGLPSLAAAGGARATGAQDVAFGADGTLHAVIGLAADPAVRTGALSGEAGAELLGTLVALGGGTPVLVADLAGFEAAEDPDGAGADSNPFSLVAQGTGFLATDAGGNDVLSIDAAGAIAVEAVLPPAPNPLPFGPPTYQAVPTGAALDGAGGLAFGQLTGFPFPQGAAQVFGLVGGALSVLAGGLSNVIDVAFGPDGTLYALSLDADGLLNPGVNGALYAVGGDGSARLLFDDLLNPTGMAVGAGGEVFVAVNGFSPDGGGVVRLAPVPLPASLPALAGGLVLLAAWRRAARPRA